MQDPTYPIPVKKVSLARSRVGGVLFIVIGSLIGYFFMLRPLQEAARTGRLEYYFKAVLLAPGFIYAGIAVCVTDLRDGTLRSMGADGKSRLTRKGRLFLVGLVIVLALSTIAWFGLLHALGFREAA